MSGTGISCKGRSQAYYLGITCTTHIYGVGRVAKIVSPGRLSP
jgi:hypothetical protein